MAGTILNRDKFLKHLSTAMGRPTQIEPQPMPKPVTDGPVTRFTDLSQADLCDLFAKNAELMTIDVFHATPETAAAKLVELCNQYGGGDVIQNKDERLDNLGLTEALANNFNTYVWSTDAEENVKFAEKANIGVVSAEYGLCETGGIVLFSTPEKGRLASLLPDKSIVVVRKSQVVPRVAQLSQVLSQRAKEGQRMPSCINIISGPSSTADIELVRVVGVHGPVKKIYLIVDDL